jgi:hypothetical protein
MDIMVKLRKKSRSKKAFPPKNGTKKCEKYPPRGEKSFPLPLFVGSLKKIIG